jgi:hypothetical protein
LRPPCESKGRMSLAMAWELESGTASETESELAFAG